MIEPTMMDVPVGVPLLARHGLAVHPHSTVSSFDGESVETRTFTEVAADAARLANALIDLGVKPGEPVATFCWNHRQHLEAYLAIPCIGAVLHTVNIRLFAEQIAYVIDHAGDRVVIVDGSLLPALAAALPKCPSVERIIVIGEPDAELPGLLDYGRLLEAAGTEFAWPDVDESTAAALCYTSGTTGHPKGVAYSHKSTFLHSLAGRAADAYGFTDRDRVLLVPPMFHANCWGMPYAAWMAGTGMVMPGPHLQADTIARLIADHQITVTAAVPTILNDLIHLNRQTRLDLSSLRFMLVGGSPVARALIEAARDELGVTVVQGWGLTETSPLCCLSVPPADADPATDSVWRAKGGRPVPGVELRLMDDAGDEVAHNGESVGELQLRGPWVTGAYAGATTPESFTSDGWLRTGDIGTIDAHSYVHITDRTKDVIKSGGEWISSAELENLLADHPAVAAAAVIGVSDPRWEERPLAVVVTEEGADVDGPALRDFLRDKVARWWLPEYWAFVDELPMTGVGKIDKQQLRTMERDGELGSQVVQRT